MHKIDKHTGLYLEWGGPFLTPVSEIQGHNGNKFFGSDAGRSYSGYSDNKTDYVVGYDPYAEGGSGYGRNLDVAELSNFVKSKVEQYTTQTVKADELAQQIIDYLSKTEWYFKQGIKSSVAARLGRYAIFDEELDKLVRQYPYVFLAVLQDEQGFKL